MVVRKEISELPLSPGDKVVTAVSHRGEIIIVTEQGAVFRIGDTQ